MRDKKVPRVAIVGAGFGGIGLAYWLNRAGINDFTIYERSSELGGVWRDNRYPGAACDVPSRFYSYSFEQDYRWSTPYGTQAEILRYLNHCADKYGAREHIRFETEIASAAFVEDAGLWYLKTNAGQAIEAEVFVSAVGLFNKIAYPDVAGRETFQGPAFHSARWDVDFDPAGKAIGVIGTGASAVQFVPAIQPKACRLLVFQRTPQYVTRRMIPDHNPNAGNMLTRRWQRLKIFRRFESTILRRASVEMTAQAQSEFFDYLAEQVPDPELRARLSPNYRFGCKRVLQSNDWYPALQQPNVEVITTPITTMTETGVDCEDGTQYPVDAIIYGTGFTPSEFLVPMDISGIGGQSLANSWKGGAEAYLGMTVSGFPNFFIMYGPNTNTAASIIYMLENQARYIAKCVKGLGRERGRIMNLRSEAQRKYNTEIQARIGATVLVDANCHSYFQDLSGKVTTQWPGRLREYRRRTRRVQMSDYEFGQV
ncbi:MAG: NAD(P)/FAD-dependent oxidoreductase [Pseudomonadota bacterium]|nr:NAD(P)/FAD-dependent oxidoreductase [Pseudomonadota bacterium]